MSSFDVSAENCDQDERQRMRQLAASIKKFVANEAGEKTTVYKIRSIITHTGQTSSDGHEVKSLVDKFLMFLECSAQKYANVFVLAEDMREEGERQLCQAFTSWCVSRVLNLLGKPSCSHLHAKAMRTLSYLMQVLKWRDPHAYRAVIVELICLSAELTTVFEKMQDKCNHSEVALQSFTVPLDLIQQSVQDRNQQERTEAKVSPIHHVITDIDHCELLQTHVTGLLNTILSDINHVASSHLTMFWMSLCCHLEAAGIPLLLKSLETVDTLLSISGLPAPRVLSYFVDCVMAVSEMVLTGSDSIENDTDVIHLENGVSKVLLGIVTADSSSNLMHHLSDNHFTTCMQQLAAFLPRFCSTPFGLKTDAMLPSLSKMACYVITKSTYSLLHSEITTICQAFVRIIDTAHDIQCLVAPIALGVCAETKAALIKSAVDKEGIVPGEVSGEISDEERFLLQQAERKVSNRDVDKSSGHGPPEGTSLSTTYQSLYTKLWSYMHQSDHVTEWRIIQVVVEVACYCVLKYGKQSHLTLSSFLYPHDLETLVTHWYTTLPSLAQNQQPTHSTACLYHLYTSIAALITTSVVQNAPLGIMTDCVCLLSLYWLPMESSWYDLKPNEPKKIAELAANLSGKIELGHIQCSMIALSALPKHICPRWRTHVLKLSMADSDSRVREAVIRNLPNYITNFRQNGFYLITDLTQYDSGDGTLGHHSTYELGSVLFNYAVNNVGVVTPTRCHLILAYNDHFDPTQSKLINVVNATKQLGKPHLLGVGDNIYSVTQQSGHTLVSNVFRLARYVTSINGFLQWDDNIVMSSLLDDADATEFCDVLIDVISPLTCSLAQSTTATFLQEPVMDRLDLPLYKNLSFKCQNHGPDKQPTVSLYADPVFIKPFMKLLSIGPDQSKLKFARNMATFFHHIDFSKTDVHTVEILDRSLSCIGHCEDEITLAFGLALKEILKDKEGQSAIDVKIMTKLAEFAACNSSNDDHPGETPRDICNKQKQASVLVVMAQLARLSSQDVSLQVALHLLDHLHLNEPLLASTAFLQLRSLNEDITERGGQSLLIRSRQQICTSLAEAMYLSESGNGDVKTPEVILQEVSRVFGFPSLRSFLQVADKFLVSHLVSKATTIATKLIALIAVHLELKVSTKLLLQKTYHIFCYLLRSCSHQQFNAAIKFIEEATNFSLKRLLRMDTQRVLNELLLYLSSHHKQVFKGFNILASNDDSYKGTTPITSNIEMANYLQPRLLGFLTFFDIQLRDTRLPLEEKKVAMESLIAIMKLMGQRHITVVRIKLMATLRISLQFQGKGFPELSCRAWSCFVRSVELTSLAPLVPQIIATLLPLTENLPRNVADLINFLIVENKASLHSHFHEIYFLPDIPELEGAKATLTQYIASPSHLSELQGYIRGISHESLEIRLHALGKLKSFLRTNQKFIHQLIIGSDCADPVISQLISLLLGACRDESPRVKLLIGECLGEVGAVDPGRLDLTTNTPLKLKAKFQASITDDQFAFDLINELVRTFLAASKPNMQDCSAYALQQLLKIYDISSVLVEGQPASSSLWDRFSGDVQDILVPLFTSKYFMPVEKKWSDLVKPICKSGKGKNFTDWITTWTEYLITKVKQDKERHVLTACAAVIRYNVHIALYLLPHIAFYVIVDGDTDDTSEVFNEIMEVLNLVKQASTRLGTATDFRHMSAQTIFSVLDYLTRWQYHRIQVLAAKTQANAKPVYLTDQSYCTISDFLNRVPQDVLAEASFNCCVYTRSLMYYERYIRNKDIQEHLNYLQRLYVMLDEPDGVVGVTKMRKAQPTLQEQILAHKSIDQLPFALSCYERAIQLEPTEISHHEGLLKSYMQLGHHSAALLHTGGLLSETPQMIGLLNSYRIEAAWKLSNWDKLETFIKQEKNVPEQHGHNWSIALGRVLLSAKNRSEAEFVSQMASLRSELMVPLSAASMDTASYLRAYDYILKLHLITEIEQLARGLLLFPDPKDDGITPDGLFHQWESRLKMAQSTFRTQEPILTLRKTLLNLVQLNRDGQWVETEIGQSWLRSAKAARKAGHLQTAYSSLLQAFSYNVTEFYIEKAKWLWQKGDQVESLSCLEKGMAEYYHDKVRIQSASSQVDQAKRLVYARILLLYGRYSEESSTLESTAIILQYKEAISMSTDWEHGHFYLGRYYDKLMTKMVNDKSKLDRQGDITIRVINYFSTSLHHGNQYIYQSLPRILSLWLDFGSNVVEAQKRAGNRTSQTVIAQQKYLAVINEAISKMTKTLAPYQLFTAFPQLISRICHAHPDVSLNLQNTIAHLFTTYPQQAMWMLTAVSKSSYQVRANRCKEIFAKAVSMKPQLQKFISDSTKLSERLLELSEKETSGNTMTLSLSQHFRNLKRLFEDSSFSDILIPKQSSMTVTLPTNPGSHSTHDPFPNHVVYIRGLEEKIEIMRSLQRPKKITLTGSDGLPYVMMCKPKDDLRRDCRLMDFTTIVNKFLRKDAESRRRQLHIRTFAVIPLNEECGMVEWINNTHGLRNILLKLYRDKGFYTSGKELQAMACPLKATANDKLNAFKMKFLPKHPPVFSEWFTRTFPDPTSWYMARLSYARTTAVMSMVGYILGLGDRHGENILFDSTNGDCVHVDFNCLFNKGETFEWPEKVPFRLTHNMVDALGPMGYEGVFRQACEVVLRVMRNQSDSLMSVLKPFVYDPLVEWSKPTKGRSSIADTGEITNEQALTQLQNIENRLKGVITAGLLPLSIEGHVNYLIKEATDENNLSQMYVGWSAYM